MTDKDRTLAQFFQEHEPPSQDARFLAEALARAQKAHQTNTIWLWIGAGSVAASVLALVGPAIGNVFVAMGPVVAPIVVAGTVLLMMRRMLWAHS
jgi:hypothetical protein